jgi:hypothetical protein
MDISYGYEMKYHCSGVSALVNTAAEGVCNHVTRVNQYLIVVGAA